MVFRPVQNSWNIVASNTKGFKSVGYVITILIYNASIFSLKFIYSEKATKFWEIFLLLLTVCIAVKSKGKVLQNFVAFSEYMNCKENDSVFLRFNKNLDLAYKWIYVRFLCHRNNLLWNFW